MCCENFIEEGECFVDCSLVYRKSDCLIRESSPSCIRHTDKLLTREGPWVCPGDFDETYIGLSSLVLVFHP